MSGIEWTDVTWNPVRGCSRVSAGCEHCYAETVARRFSGPGQPYHGLTNRHGAWNGQIMLVPEKLTDPLRWRKPRRIFVNSMSDLFHEAVPEGFIARVFHTMARTPQHTYQILTKRPGRMGEVVPRVRALVERGWPQEPPRHWYHAPARPAWGHVWLGVSVEDQATADERIPLLLGTPAAVRFVSYEPALGPVKFGQSLCGHRQARGFTDGPRVDWLIVGGESGPGARPCDVQWIRSAVQQCRDSSVPVFVKQLGAKPSGWCRNVLLDDSGAVDYPHGFCDNYESSESGHCGDRCVFLAHRKGGDPAEWPEDLHAREWPAA